MDLSGSMEDLNKKLYLDVHEWCNIDEVRREIRMRVDSIKDTRLRALCSDILWNEKDFWLRPASMVHHSMAGGLAKHTLEVLCYSAQLISMLRAGYVLSTDLVIVGSCLHDIGKLEIAINITETENYSRHIDSGIAIVARYIDNYGFTDEEKEDIIGMIKSHHTEFSNVKRPAYRNIEGFIVHLADCMSGVFGCVVPKICLGKEVIQCYNQENIRKSVFR